MTPRLLCCCVLLAPATLADYVLPVSPAEHQQMVDPATGVELNFLTTHPDQDTNLYFHERSWLADDSLILFNSARDKGGTMGYVTATGELIRFQTPEGGVEGATAARNRSSVFALRGREVLELALRISSPADTGSRSLVTVRERKIAVLPDLNFSTSLNESADGRYLSMGAHAGDALGGRGQILLIAVESGEVTVLCEVPESIGYQAHVQWSNTNPNLLSFAGKAEHRLWVVDIRNGVPRNAYVQQEGELVTHESWWVNDQILFCGGTHAEPTEDAHVKVLNIHSGEVRIVGAGAWWAGGAPSEIAKENWWHADGGPYGRWVVADNWHGDIVLFQANTTRERELTLGHRTYGKGDHPHVGWDNRGAQVVFTSHLLGDPNVCVATIPQAWQDENP